VGTEKAQTAMTQLLVLFLILLVPTAVLMLVSRFVPRVRLSGQTSARVGLTALLVVTALGHFARTEGMAAMLPRWVPHRSEIVLATGVLELLGAVELWIPGLTRTTGALLIVMFLGFLPVNVSAAVNRVEFGGHDLGPVYLLARVPFQLLLVAWTYWATGQRWLRGRRSVLTSLRTARMEIERSRAL
jgi:uncharacterized membrane protein